MNQKEKKYLDYIRANCPETPLQNVTFNFLDGAHSDIVIADGKTVFRFAKFDWAVCYLNNAARAVRLAGNYVDMPLPDLVRLEPGVVKYDFIPGKPLLRNEYFLGKSLERDCLAKKMGTFLSQLHAVPLKEAKAARLEDHFAERKHLYWESQYRELEKKLFPYCDNYTRDSIRELFRIPLEKEDFFNCTPCLFHADPGPRHIICDRESHAVSTVVGFGSSGIGDPAQDTAALLAGFGEDFVSKVAEYDESIPEHLDRARFYAAVRPLDAAKELADRIATRDFSNYQMGLTEPCVLPVGKH